MGDGLSSQVVGRKNKGKLMNLLDSFMNNREIQLQVNGMKSPNRKCGKYGFSQ